MRHIGIVKRIVVVVVTVGLILQSSGAAAAQSRSSFSFPAFTMPSGLTSAIHGIAETRIVAQLTGAENRWDAMHAAPPRIKPNITWKHILPPRFPTDHPHFSVGIRRNGPPMQSALAAWAPHPDPRALGPSSGNVRMSSMMSVGPVQPYLFEADVTTAPTTLFVTAGAESGAVSRAMVSAPTNASATQTLTFAPTANAMSFGWISPANVPNSTSWPAQTYTVTLHVTQPNANLKLTEVKIYRVNSAGGPGTAGLAGVADKAGLSQSLGSAGTLTFTLTGTAQTASASDRIGVKFSVLYSGTTTTTFGYSSGQNSGSGLNLGTPTAASSTSGIIPWWTYVERPLPGGGQYLVNVASGNLLVQDTDVNVPERGIDLAFQRTYNSQSGHDSLNSDGSVPSQYGDAWTNTFDAHLSYNGANIIIVHDADGARYDYTADGSGNWLPPAGQHATLTFDGACGYRWTKKTGTILYFYSPDLNADSSCPLATQGSFPQDTAYGGRLYQIIGRNHNNAITLSYSWNPDATNASHLTSITATHTDGHVLTMTFGTAVSGGPTELLSIARPDGQTIAYHYDPTTGSTLQQVILPGNGTGSQSTLTKSFGYNAGDELGSIGSPRYNANAADGENTDFGYGNAASLIEVDDVGVVNFTPSDGTSSVLQSGVSGTQTWRVTQFTQPAQFGTGTSSMSDSYGHATSWTLDSQARVTQTSEATGEASPTNLVTTQTWDGNNNLLQRSDARGNATSFAYDPNGNLIAVAAPAVTIGSATFRPTTLISYDITQGVNYNNVTSYCDPVSNHPSRDWSPSTSPTPTPLPCPTSAPATVAAWDHSSDPTAEPFGRLSSVKTPTGYNISYGYNTANEGGVDAGLPTSITAAAIPQYNGTQMQFSETLTYNVLGDETSLQNPYGTSTAQYDSLNRIIQAEDASGISSYACYNANGSVHYTETAAQHSSDGGQINVAACAATAPQWARSFAYDPDNDVIKSFAHFNSEVSETDSYYDGDDRLVETAEPWDSSDYANKRDYYPFRWMQRYVYDISQGGTQSFYGQTFNAHGGLARSQEYLAGTNMYWDSTMSPSTPSLITRTWQDRGAWASDLVERLVSAYSYDGQALHGSTNAYDATTSTVGELSSTCDELSQCRTFDYDADGNLTQRSYTNVLNATPALSYGYDADGRATSITSSTYGTQSYVFNADGTLQKSVEPSSGGVSSVATLTYHYYLNGLRSSVDISSSPSGTGINQTNFLQYAYQSDKRISALGFTDGAASSSLAFTYDAAGKLQSRAETTSGSPAYNTSYTYDSSGHVLSETFPSGAISAMTYGHEDERTTFSVLGVGPYTVGFNVRGEELLGNGTAFGTSANGALVDEGTNSKTYFNALFPRLTSHELVFSTGNTGSGYTFNSAGERTTFNTDGVGRTGTMSYDGNHSLVGLSSPVSLKDKSGVTYYHITTMTYGWGPNGHPIQVGGVLSSTQAGVNPQPSQPETLHWDGDQLLFTTKSSGSVDDVKIGSYADYTPLDPTYGGTTFWDRDLGNTVVAAHNSTGASTLSQPTPWASFIDLPAGSTIKIPTFATFTKDVSNGVNVGHGLLISASRADGYNDGFTELQGARAYDPPSQQWMTRDQLSTLGEPRAASPYTWNLNSPTSYLDPSGFCGTVAGAVTIKDRTVTQQVPDPNDPSCDIVNEKAKCGFCWTRPLEQGLTLLRSSQEDAFRGHEAGVLGPSERFNVQEASFFAKDAFLTGARIAGPEMVVEYGLERVFPIMEGSYGFAALEPFADAGGAVFSYTTLGAVQLSAEHQLYKLLNGPEGNPYPSSPGGP